MPPENSPPDEKKKLPYGLGLGRLPPAFDLALRWGLTLAISVLLGFFLGRWVDSKLNTTPIFLLIGIFWGFGGSFYSLYLQVKRLQEKQDKEDKSDKPPYNKVE